MAFGGWMPPGHSLNCGLVSVTTQEPLQTLFMQYDKQIMWQKLEHTPLRTLFLPGTSHNSGELYFQTQHLRHAVWQLTSVAEESTWIWDCHRMFEVYSWCPLIFFFSELINSTGMYYRPVPRGLNTKQSISAHCSDARIDVRTFKKT